MFVGNLVISGQRCIICLFGEVEILNEFDNFVVKLENGVVYLKDIVMVRFKEEEKIIYVCEFGIGVVMLDVKK